MFKYILIPSLLVSAAFAVEAPKPEDFNKTFTKEEFMARAEKEFTEIDTNADGKITPDEKREHAKKRFEALKRRNELRHEGKEDGEDKPKPEEREPKKHGKKD